MFICIPSGNDPNPTSQSRVLALVRVNHPRASASSISSALNETNGCRVDAETEKKRNRKSATYPHRASATASDRPNRPTRTDRRAVRARPRGFIRADRPPRDARAPRDARTRRGVARRGRERNRNGSTRVVVAVRSRVAAGRRHRSSSRPRSTADRFAGCGFFAPKRRVVTRQTRWDTKRKASGRRARRTHRESHDERARESEAHRTVLPGTIDECARDHSIWYGGKPFED